VTASGVFASLLRLLKASGQVSFARHQGSLDSIALAHLLVLCSALCRQLSPLLLQVPASQVHAEVAVHSCSPAGARR